MSGRPLIGNTRMINDTYAVEEDKLKKLRELAKLLDRSKSSLIREGIDRILAMKRHKALLGLDK